MQELGDTQEVHRFHGTDTRGLAEPPIAFSPPSSQRLVGGSLPTSPSFEGRFGRMFRRLPVFDVPDSELQRLAEGMREEGPQPESPPGNQQPTGWGADPGAPTEPTPSVLDGDNESIPAGYTYLGQFIDHDITFDPASSLQRANDPDSLVDFRTPRFDLDSLYGRGPADEPYLYDRQSPGGLKLLTGPVFDDAGNEVAGEIDLLRNGRTQERAIIGDPRNDENTIVSQLHLAFVRFHNRVVDVVAERGFVGSDLLKEVQRIVRWHYQWVVVHDYLKRTIGEVMWERLFRLDKPDDNGVSDPPWREPKLRYYAPRVKAYMPVEFSVAAFRFGHSQVRNGYRINDLVTVPTFTPNPTPGRLEDLRGFRLLPPQWQVSWPHLFQLDDTAPQPSRLINTKLAAALFELPGEPVGDVVRRSLPFRNLLRSKALQLPSGQAVAAAIGAKVLSDDELGAAAPTPLWFYILKEAEVRANGRHLGEVGGRIVGETVLGMLRADKLSFYSVAPDWQPGQDLNTAAGEAFDMAELLRFAVPDRASRF